MEVTMVKFFRTKKQKNEDKGEFGLMINSDELIIDQNSKPVPAPIYDYTRYNHLLTLHIEFPEK